MGKHNNKKGFIQRSEGSTFRLLHRSQKDPLIVDESLGDRVLHPVSNSTTGTTSNSDNLEERQKFGIYYKDDYNYLQHLKLTGEVCSNFSI